ncbi:MAG: tetratricopeptide repeat protein [Candidatus Thorarchaeota archaeon]
MPEVTGEELIDAAIFLIRRDEPGKAAALLGPVIEQIPSHSGAWGLMGIARHMLGELDKAESALLKSLSIDRRNTRTLFYLGLVLYDKEKYGEAEELLRECADLDPKSERTWNLLGKVYLRHNNRDEAETCFRRVTVLKPDWVEGWHNLSVAIMESGNLRAAVGPSRRALELDPENPKAAGWFGLVCNSLIDEGKFAEAEEILSRGTLLHPNEGFLWYLLFLVYGRQKRHEEAQKAMDNAMKRDSEFAEKVEELLGNSSEVLKFQTNRQVREDEEESPLHAPLVRLDADQTERGERQLTIDERITSALGRKVAEPSWETFGIPIEARTPLTGPEFEVVRIIYKETIEDDIGNEIGSVSAHLKGLGMCLIHEKESKEEVPYCMMKFRYSGPEIKVSHPPFEEWLRQVTQIWDDLMAKDLNMKSVFLGWEKGEFSSLSIDYLDYLSHYALRTCVIGNVMENKALSKVNSVTRQNLEKSAELYHHINPLEAVLADESLYPPFIDCSDRYVEANLFRLWFRLTDEMLTQKRITAILQEWG